MSFVAHIVSLRQLPGSTQRYMTGRSLKFLPLTPNSSAGGGPTIAVSAVIIHGQGESSDSSNASGGNPIVNVTPPSSAPSRFSVASVGDPLVIGDIVKTAPDTVAAIQFVIGGCVGINAGSAVKIVSERSVTDYELDYWRVVVRQFGILSRVAKLKETIMIQTNGGVMGIKG